MKTKKLIVLALGISSLATMPSVAGPGIGLQINIPAPVVTVPAPVVTVPAPAVTVAVPDTYVWDGTKYVGVVGSQYYYLGPDNVWLTLDGPRWARFHDWEHGHADWRTHAIHNDRFRGDAHARDISHDNHQSHDFHDDRHQYNDHH